MNLKEKRINNEMMLCITHNDLDGVACNVLMELCNFDTPVVIKNVETNQVEKTIIDFVEEEDSIPYWIIINDLSFINDSELVMDLNELCEKKIIKLTLIDHHPTATWLNKYSWASVKPDADNGSASYQTYKYLSSLGYILPNARLNSWIRSVSRYDTWVWKTSDIFKQDEYENILLDIYGIDFYVESIIVKLMTPNSQGITYSYTETKLIQNYIQKRETKLIKVSEEKIKKINFFGETLYLSLSNAPISALKEKIELLYPDAKDSIIAILYADEMKLSMRTTSDNIDLGKIAVSHAKDGKGGGHKKAAGCTLPVDVGLELLRRYHAQE